MKFRKILILFVSIIMCSAALSFNAAAEDETFSPLHRQLDFDEDTTDWVYEEPDPSTGTSVLLWENYGGFWADAEKSPTDTDDDLACWAATCANMLEWTGWGYVGGMQDGNTDTFFAYYQDHTTDKGSLNAYALEWWFNGNLPCPDPADWSEENVEGADFWSSSYTWTNYVHDSWSNTNVPQNIESYITSGYAVGFAIYPITPPGGHAITCWGYNYDPTGTTPEDKYLGVWVSDSDSHKGSTDPDDVLRYYEIDYETHGTDDTSDDYWYMPNYGSGWKIAGVTGLEPFPGEIRPIADAGGSYVADEASTIWFDSSGSTDDDSLTYRWDWDDDGTWDTGWLTSTLTAHTWYDDYIGDVRLEVFDGRLRDIDVASVTVNNVAPTISVFATDCDEDSLSTLQVLISDPSPADSFAVHINWGEGPTEGPYNYGPGTTSLLKTHQYLDDNPSGTASDDYTVTAVVVDDDGGSDEEEYIYLTVSNLAPVVTIDSMAQPNPQFILPKVHELDFGASFSDTGTIDTHTIEWDFGDETAIITGTMTPSHTYMEPGDYTITLTITDDDIGQDSATWDIEVVDALGALEDLDDYLQDLPNDNYKDKAKNRKKSFDNKFNAMYKMLENEEFQKIIDKLNLDIRIKFDGTIDGDPIDDWVTDPTAQTHICQKIDDIIAYLEYLLTL